MQSEINADDFFSTLEEEQEAQAPAPVAEEPVVKPALSADEFFDSIEQEGRTASKAILAKDPAVANRERIAAQQMETSRIDAAANLGHYEDIANRNAVREKLKDAPIFTGFLVNDQNNAPIFQNDIDGFIDIEKRMAKFGLELNEDGELDLTASAETGWQAARKDVVQNATVGFSSGQAVGEQGIMWANARDGLTDIDDAFKKRSAEYDKAMEAMQGNDSWIAAAGEVVGTMYAALTNSVNETAAGSAVMVGAGMAAGLTAPAMAPILGAAAMGGSMGAMYKIEGGLAYKEMIEKGARPEEARLISQGVGLVNSLIEVGGMTVLGKAAAPLLRALTTKHAGKTAAALASPEMGKLVLEASKVMGKGVAAEVTTEVMQELVNVAGEGLAKEFAGAKFDDATGEAIFDRLSEVAIKTLKGTMVLGALGMGPTIVASARKVYKAREAEDFFNALHENMSKSEAAEMAPEVVADAVQQMSDEARIGKVYVDAAEFYQVVKDHGITMEQLEQTLPGIGETLAEKALNKEDLVFQTGEYASKIAGTELGKSLTQHMRLDPDALSVADAAKVEAETKRLLAASMNGKISEADLDRSIANMADDEYKAEYDKLKVQMYESIKATGSYSDSEAKANAKLGAWQVANLVRRAGLPASMIAKLAPTIHAPASNLSKPSVHATVKDAFKEVIDAGSQATTQEAGAQDAQAGTDSGAGAAGGNREGNQESQDAVGLGEDALKQLIGRIGAAALYGAKVVSALDDAKRMFDEGVDARAILKETGWQRGYDGEWRYEIPDLKIKNNLLSLPNETRLKLSDVVEAPELFGAYPWLKDIYVISTAKVVDNAGTDPETFNIYLNLDNITEYAERKGAALEDEVRESMVHEIQHIIQIKEGFAVGTSVVAQRKPYLDFMKLLGLDVEKYDPAWDEDPQAFIDYIYSLGLNDVNQQAAQILSEHGFTSFEEFAKKYSPYARYRANLGELDSRIVEKRLKLSEAARRRLLLTDQLFLDVDPASLILATTGLNDFEPFVLKQETARPVFGSALIKHIGRSKARAEAINRLLELMSTEYQRVIVEGAKGSTQRKYQKVIDKAVQDAAKKAGVDLSDMESPVTRELLTMTVANDLIFATQSNKSAIGWYDEKVRKCLAFAGSMFPELDPNNEEYDKNEAFRFLYILATTSNGLKVEKNLPLAVKIYKQYKETGTIPAIGEGKQLEPMVETLRNFDKTLESIGNIDDMRKFFMTTWTVKQLELMGFNATGELKDEETRGAAIIGPKIGNGFFANLNGMFSALTMDRWFMRTWGRWTGTLIVFDEAKFVERVDHFRAVLEDIKDNKEFCEYLKEHCNFDVKDALKNRMAASTMAKMEKSVTGGSSEFIKMVNRCATAMMPASMRKEYHKKWGGKTKPDSIGWRFYKAMKDVERAELQDRVAPGGGKQRQYVRSIFADALDIVRQEEGLGRLTMADAQAVLWYAEKKIYENTKIAGEYVEDYDQDEAPDYANVMRDVALRNGVSEETLKALSDRVDKEIENDELQRSQGSERARYDTLDTVSKRRLFSSLVFSALRRNKGLSVANGAKPGQRIPFTYRVERAVEEAGVSESGRGGVVVISADDARGDRGGRGSVRVLTPVATWIPNAGVSAALKGFQEFQNRDSKTANPEFEEFAPTEEAATLFLDSLKAAKATLGYPAACVEEKSIEELTGQDEWHSQCRIFLSKDRKSGFVIKNGDDLVSVFSSRGFNSGDAIVECAIAAGARKLDCFDTILPNVYARHGFRPVARLKFNRDYAPYDWNYDFFGGKMQKMNKDGTPKVDKDGNPVYTTNFNNGEPDIIFMVYDNSFNGQLAEDYLLSIPETDGENYGEPYVSDAVKALEETNKVVQETVDEAVAEKANGKSKEEVLHQQYRTLKQIAWHGSPYRFIKFMLDKIGTGEGAQAHGWGLYFSLDRKTAEGYRARLADDGAIIKVKGYEFDENDMSDESPDVMAYNTVAWLINEAGPYNYGDFEEIRAKAIEVIENAVLYGADKADAAKAVELVKALTADDVVIDGSIGGLYKVDIPEDSVMLNEDEAFKDQPEFVQKAVRELYKKLNTKRSIRETAQASAAAAIVERSKIVESIQKMVADGVLEIEGNQHPQAIANSIVWALTDYLYRALNRESLPLWEYRYRQRELVVAEIGLSGSAEAINNIDFDIETLMMEAEQAFGMDHEDMPGAGFRASLYINPEKTGQDIYDDLSTALGSDKEASLALNSVGIKGIRYDGYRDGPCAVVFDEDAVNILEMAQAELDEFLSHIEQANMVTTGSYSITNNSITLTPNANLTTFAHEMGHWYLETLFAIYDQTTSASVRADVETMLKDFGLNSIEAWYKLPMKDREVLHERFAFYVEQYFAEGKAPTKETRGFFQRFGAWIRAWYSRFGGGAKEELNKVYRERFDIDLPEMSDEVRRVLDRMMAAESSIKQAEAAEGIMPLFKQKPEDMDEKLWQQLMQESDDADSEATDKVFARMARDEKWYTNARSKKLRDMQRAAKETRNAIRAKVEKEVDDTPEMKLLNLVKANNMRLSEDDLRMEGVPAESIATLRKAGLTVPNYTAPGKYNQITLGALRQWAAFIYKADTNQQVIKALLIASDREGLIEELTTQRCLKDRGELFDPKKMDAAITEAIHNEARSRFIATELSYLANDKEGRSRIYREAARRVAEQMINSMPIGSIRVRKFVAAEARASRAAFEALAKGDRYAAVLNKRAQLVQHEAALMAIEIEKEMRRVADLKSRIFRADKKIAKTHDIDIINIARYVLTNEGLGKTSPDQYTPEAAMKYVDRLKKYDPDKFALYSAMLDKHAYKGAIDFSRYTVQYAMEVIEDVQMLYRQARDAKTIMLDGKRQDREQVVDELIERFNMVDRSEWDGGKDRVISASGKLEFAWMSFKSKMIRIENWCHAMDGSAIGPFFKYIYLPIANAAAKFRNLNNKTQEALVNVLKPMIGKWANVRDIQAPELGYTFATKAELIGALLHTGNASNKAKLLLGGRGEGKPWARLVELQDGSNYTDTTQWDGFISRCMQSGIITKEDMDVVQQIWDLTESTKPVAQAAFKALYGTYFEEVEAEEIVTPWGNYRGGYVPAITDKYLVPEKTTQEEAKRITQQDFVSQMPVHQPGFSKTRVPNYTKPLALDVGLLCGHIQEVLKFATMAPVAQEVAKILSDKRFAEPIEKHDPTWISQMLVPWLKRSFEQTVSDGKTDMFSSKLNQLRGIAGMNIMCGHIVNALQQWTGLSIAATKVDPRYMAKAQAKLIKGELTPAHIMGMSPYMMARLKDRAFEFQSQIERIARTTENVKQAKGAINKIVAADEKLDAARDWIGRHGYFIQTAMQFPIDTIVWGAAYQQSIDQGMSSEDAVANADSIVRTTQSAFDPENVSEVETGSALYRCFLVFYNYFNMQLNLLGEKWEGTKHTKKYGKFALDSMLIVAIPSIVSAILTQMISGFDTGDDDEWDTYDTLRLLIAEPIKNVIAMAPFLGSFVTAAGTQAANRGVAWAQFVWGEDPYQSRALSSPAADALATAMGAPFDLAALIEGEDVNARKVTRNTLDLLSMVTRMPLGALKKPAGWTAGYLAGEIEPESIDEVVRGLISGKDVSK